MIDNADMLIIAADRCIATSDRIRDIFEYTPAISGISDAVDNFVVPRENIE